MSLDLESDDGRMIHEWIGFALETERKKLVQEKKEYQQKENTKKLAEIASKISNLLNQDMQEQACSCIS